ncbi:MAG: ribulose-phosphate 3-epimerase [Terriglobia bacterium]
MALIVPSLLSFDWARLNEGLELIRRAGIQTIHVDVCDGHFVPGITVGQPVVQNLSKAAGLEIEVHLLVERPERFLKDFAKAGAGRIAIHPESTRRLFQALGGIRALGCRAGVALNPETPVDSLSAVFEKLDFLILLCGDQEFQASLSGEAASNEEARMRRNAIQKLRTAIEARMKSGYPFTLAVEGAMTRDRAREFEAAGADILIVGAESDRGSSPGAHLADLVSNVGQTGGTFAI